MGDFHFNRPLSAASLATLNILWASKVANSLLDVSSNSYTVICENVTPRKLVCDKSTKIVHLKNFTIYMTVYHCLHLFIYTNEKKILLHTKLENGMHTKLENGILHNKQQPLSVVNGFY